MPGRLWMTAALLSATVACAHEHWILVEAGATAAGPRKVRICSGHSFPASEIRLAERLLTDMEVVGPGGGATAFKPAGQGNSWEADVTFDKPGVWYASFALRKPQEDQPLYRGRCLIVVGGRDDPARYAGGKGLELVPGASLGSLKPGDTLPVSIRMDGAPIEGKISVAPENGAVSFISTGRDRPAQIRIGKAGAYMLAASHKGKTFALTFTVTAPAGTGAP